MSKQAETKHEATPIKQPTTKKSKPTVDDFTKEMERPIRVKVKNLESSLPVYVTYHFDKEKAPGFKVLQNDTIETIPLGAVIELLVNQTIYNEKPKFDLHGQYAGKQGANHAKYTVQLLDPVDDKYINYVERRTKNRQMIPAE